MGLYDQIIHRLDQAFRRLEGTVPPPQRIQRGDGFVFRYTQKTIQQAIVQKLARMIPGLHAARFLFEKGLVQEQAAIQRMLDETDEDILFLAIAVIKNDQTPLHCEYLEEFYKEENNNMVKRWRIREYLAQIIAAGEQGTLTAASRQVYAGYSGFVHGASPNIMELYGGNPPRFYLHGISGTDIHEGHRYDLYNPFFRAVVSFAVAAKALGDEESFRILQEYQFEVDRLSGRNLAYHGENAQQPTSNDTPPTRSQPPT
jgi:hypothetical protein